MFGNKQSERMPTRKIWDYVIEIKEGFVPREGGDVGVHKGTIEERVY